jgi:hypothetical protein
MSQKKSKQKNPQKCWMTCNTVTTTKNSQTKKKGREISSGTTNIKESQNCEKLKESQDIRTRYTHMTEVWTINAYIVRKGKLNSLTKTKNSEGLSYQ